MEALALRRERCDWFPIITPPSNATGKKYIDPDASADRSSVEGIMADQIPVSAGHPDMDYAEHEATYALFLKLLKAVAIGVVLIILFLAFMWG